MGLDWCGWFDRVSLMCLILLCLHWFLLHCIRIYWVFDFISYYITSHFLCVEPLSTTEWSCFFVCVDESQSNTFGTTWGHLIFLVNSSIKNNKKKTLSKHIQQTEVSILEQQKLFWFFWKQPWLFSQGVKFRWQPNLWTAQACLRSLWPHQALV